MPELPEVEINCQHLHRHLQGATIKRVEVLRSAGRFLSEGSVEGRRVTDVRRVGKLIIIALDDGTWVRSHLAMSGLWSSRGEPWSFDYVEAKREPGDERHARLVLHTDRGEMVYHDQRMFGRMEHGPGRIDMLPGQGYEWIETERGVFDTPSISWLCERTGAAGKVAVRSFLCDQRELPGVGNIYSAEAMFWMHLYPGTLCEKLDFEKVVTLRRETQRALQAAITRGLDYSSLAVYRKKLCPFGHQISTMKMDGRTVYLCETCQPR